MSEALLRHIVGSLVQHPDEVEIRTLDRRGEPVLELRVAEEDFPRVIGRQGRNARALRVIVESAHRGPGLLSLNIVDPEDDGQPV